ncbi:hypothetical protein EDD11_006561, partial [Mortierella claussenii]
MQDAANHSQSSIDATIGADPSSTFDDCPFWLETSCSGSQILYGRLPRVAQRCYFERVGHLEKWSNEVTVADLEKTMYIPSAKEIKLALDALQGAGANSDSRIQAWFGEPSMCMSSQTILKGLRFELLHRPDVRKLTLRTRSACLSINSVLRFANEEWLDDEAIDRTLHELSKLDTGKNKFVLIPLQHWRPDCLALA